MSISSDLKDKELKPIEPEKENLYSGGRIVQVTYQNRCGKHQTIYYCPRNGKYYENCSIAKITDRELGGNGEIDIIPNGIHTNGMPDVDDSPDLAHKFNR